MRKLFAIPLITGLLFLASCQQDQPDLHTTPNAVNPEDAELIAELGYDTTDIIQIEDGYIVEGDILMTEDLLKHIRNEAMTRQTWYPSLGIIDDAYCGDVKVRLAASILLEQNSRVNWEEMFKKAIDAWNSVPDSKLKLRYVTSSPSDIYVEDWSTGTYNHNSDYTSVVPCHAGKAGPSIYVNTKFSYLGQFADQQILMTIVHALGHTIGLGHTPATTGTMNDVTNDVVGGGSEATIEGTEGNDNKSVMVKSNVVSYFSSLSEKDIKAIQKLYGPTVTELDPGAIPSALSINSDAQETFTINSSRDASGGDGNISYSWEMNLGSGWVNINNSGKSLTTQPAQVATARYRRTATSAGENKVSNICTVTDTYYTTCQPGKIESEIVSFSGETFTINSLSDGRCKDLSALTYSWESDLGNGWETVPGNQKTLTAIAPEVFSSRYRRNVTCDHGTVTSNICTVINPFYLEGGSIPERIDLNLDRWAYGLYIPSLQAPSIVAQSYYWEVEKNGVWQRYGTATEELSISGYNPTTAEQMRVRRVAVTKYGSAYSNECVVVDHFFKPDPLQGSSFSNPIPAGTHNTDFRVRGMVDTSLPGFSDLDRATGYGNDGVIRMILEEDYMVAVVLYSDQLRGPLATIDYTAPDGSFASYHINGFPDTTSIIFDVIDNSCAIHRFMPAGEYYITVQGTNMMNGSSRHGPIYYSFTGSLPEL